MHPFQQIAVAVTFMAFVFTQFKKYSKRKENVFLSNSGVLQTMILGGVGILFICMAYFGNTFFQIIGMVFAVLGAFAWHTALR